MNRKNVCVRNVKIGEGKPKICIPLVGRTEEEILRQAKALLKYPADLVEWRADWFDGLQKPEAVKEVLRKLRGCLGESLPLLFTVRTKQEGGEAELSQEEYAEINLAAAKSGLVDLADVELFGETVSRWEGGQPAKGTGYPGDFALGEKVVLDLAGRYRRPGALELVRELREAGVRVIGSSHDFSGTPSVDTMVNCLRAMQVLEADICKLAVMPKCRGDVMALLTATWQMDEKYADRPVITMSMGRLGLLSRLSGELSGSAVTFGTAGQASAPGQMEAGKLAEWLEALHEEEMPVPGKVVKDNGGRTQRSDVQDRGSRTKPPRITGHIFLIGFMGAGKSTVASALEKRLGARKIEMDACIEQRAGQSISAMFREHGEAYFRGRETEFLFSLEECAPAVVSCGGGVVVREENTAFMRSHGKIVLLTAAPETILKRVKDSQERPILNGNMNVDFIRRLQEKRRVQYEAAADVVISTDGKSVEEICQEILESVSG